MTKYMELDPKFLLRYFGLLENHGRGIDKKYTDDKCGKEMFVARTMRKWLKNKCFVVIQKDPTGTYATHNKDDLSSYYEVRIPKKHYIQITGCSYQLGYGDKISIFVDDVSTSTIFNDRGFSFNDFNRLQFREITKEEFNSVKSMFVDDRDEKEYEMIAHAKTYVGKSKKPKWKETKIKVMGKDYQEARELAAIQYPEYVIYG